MQLRRVALRPGRCTGHLWPWMVLGPGVRLQGGQEAGSGGGSGSPPDCLWAPRVPLWQGQGHGGSVLGTPQSVACLCVRRSVLGHLPWPRGHGSRVSDPLPLHQRPHRHCTPPHRVCMCAHGCAPLWFLGGDTHACGGGRAVGGPPSCLLHLFPGGAAAPEPAATPGLWWADGAPGLASAHGHMTGPGGRVVLRAVTPPSPAGVNRTEVRQPEAKR